MSQRCVSLPSRLVYYEKYPTLLKTILDIVKRVAGCLHTCLCVCSQLALTHSPPLSEIFVFTDASPKDAHLFNSVKALALEKQCKVGLLHHFVAQLKSS